MLRNLQLFPSLLLLTVASLAVSVPARADFVAMTSLSGTNEVPNPVVTDAFGDAMVSFNTAANTLTYMVNYYNLSGPATGGHIHFAPIGSNGPIVLPFVPGPVDTSGMVNGVLTNSNITAAAIALGLTDISLIAAEIQAGNTYVNIHSSVYPAGEIRGQLATAEPIPEPGSVALVGLGLIGTLVLKRRRK